MRQTSLIIFLTLLAHPAWSAFGCDVVSASDDVVTLHEHPDASSPIVTAVPPGVVVSLFDEAEDRVGSWVRVAYSVEQTAFWGEGVKGWILDEHLGECG